ncbi:MAG: 4Fe-4S cluster-binding domain-containing protein [Clostridia bacterium]|nr:4Fe-4S cluster-binding domain-containing protein [Clostridia bacterium]
MSIICNACPRKCNSERSADGDKHGFCRYGTLPVVARASLHFWEEPCISGDKGSGTVFFSGCNLKCVYCQNETISHGGTGKPVTIQRLREIFYELYEKGAHNINLVTPTHFVKAVAEALEDAPPIPIVYNCGGYESVETLKMLDGKIQIYLTDMKYADNTVADKYSSAPDYFEVCRDAVAEMYRQTGDYVIDDNGIMQRGVIIRHLVLPDNLQNTFGVIDCVKEMFPHEGQVLFSLMSQFTPVIKDTPFEELHRTLTAEEYEKAEHYLFDSGIEDGFLQELDSAEKQYIPDFDLSGV